MKPMRGLTVVIVLVMVLAGFGSIMVSVEAINDPAQPATGGTAYVVGDWTVQSALEYHDSTLDVRGDITIDPGASLTLNNMTLRMNSSFNGEFGIRVLTGGTFNGYNGTVITAVNGAWHYTFVVEAAATLELDDVTVTQCGVSNDNNVENIGLFVMSDDVRINNSKLNNNAVGIVTDNVNITLTNSTINSNIGNGAYLFGAMGGTYENLNLSFNGVYGMSIVFCEDIYLENVSATQNTFDGFASYRSNYTFEKIFSFKNTRLGILAQSSNLTVRNSTFLKNPATDVYLTGHNQTAMTGSGNVDLFDTTFSTWHLHDMTQSLNASFSVNVSVSWWDDKTPIAGATISIFNNSDTSDGNLTFTGTTDAAGRIDDIWIKTYGENLGGINSYGPHTFEAEKDGRIYSLAFNVSRPWDEVDIEIDRNPPVLDISSPADGAIFNYTTITFSGSASDHDGISKVEASSNGQNWTTAVGTLSWSLDLDLMDGDHSIVVRAFDGFGATTDGEVNVTVDTVLPPIVITSPTYNELTNGSIIMVTGTTEPGVALESGGINRTNDAGNFSFEVALLEGSNSVTVKATDLAGNSNSTSLIIRRDSIAPVLNVTWPPQGFGTTLDYVEVSGRVEGATKISFGTDENLFETVPANKRFSHDVPLVEGENVITIKAWDEAGNHDIEVITVIRDTTAPPLYVAWEGGNLTNLRHITVNITTEVGANVTVNGVQAENADGNAMFFFELDEGLNTIHVRARDWLGNLNVSSFQVEADFSAPDVMVDSPVEGFVHASRLVNFFGTALDDMVVTNVEISIDGGDWTNANGTETWYYSQELGPGAHRVEVRAWDLASNSRTIMVNFSVLADKADTELPSIRITWPKEGSTIPAGTVTFTGTAFDDTGVAAVQYSLDGVSWLDCNGTAYWSATLKLEKGTQTIYFRAIDDSGKTNITSISIETKVTRPRTNDDIWSGGLGLGWLMVALVLAIVLVTVYLIIMTARSKRAMDDEERMEREVLEEEIEDDEAVLGTGDEDGPHDDEKTSGEDE